MWIINYWKKKIEYFAKKNAEIKIKFYRVWICLMVNDDDDDDDCVLAWKINSS